jgi:hypothetical protein
MMRSGGCVRIGIVVVSLLEADEQATGGSWSLEVRWIRPGQVPSAMVAWLGASEDGTERRVDRYLVEPLRPELSVKIRAGVRLDLKAFRGARGELEVPGGLGRIEAWEKWTFPVSPDALDSYEGSSWRSVAKVRRRRSFRMEDGQPVERPLEEAELEGCTIELTEFTVGGETWWTVGLEATGGQDTLERDLLATARVMFDRPLPGDAGLDRGSSMSYAQWLGTE